MIIGDILYKKIKDLQAKVRYLKTTHFKTATTISTLSKTTTVNFSLMLEGQSGNIFSTKRAVISLATTDGSDMVSACYLKGATPSNIDDRQVEILRLQPQDGVIRYGVAVTAGNASDFNTLIGGGSVNLSYTIEVVGSSNFNVSVAYKNIDGGSV